MTPAHLSPEAAYLFRQTVDGWQQHLRDLDSQRTQRRRQWRERALAGAVIGGLVLWGAWRGGWA